VCAELKQGARAAVSCCSTPATAELRRQNTGDGVPAPGMVYGTLILALKKQGDVGRLTGAGIRTGRPCRVTGGGAQRRARGQVGASLLRDPELHGSMCGVPAKPMEESAWPERHRLRPIAMADEHT